MEQKALTVTQITSEIKELLESNFLNVFVQGEVSNCKFHQNGHIYFTLKDTNAQISCVMFRYKRQGLTFSPKDGDKVQVKGNISVYSPRGNYQIIVSSMSLFGVGSILQMLEERKQKYYELGYFEESKKRPLPAIPKTIGIVTSPTGAALRDILQIATRRNSAIDIIIFPCLVQGDGAEKTIVDMIEIANYYKMCDILIITRGGGSIEDLLPFSQDSVIQAVVASQIPTVTAVGHEIDWAICDFASDKRAPTPSAAAELCFPQKLDIKKDIEMFKNTLEQGMDARMKNARLLLQTFSRENMEYQFSKISGPYMQRLDYATEQLEKNMTQKIQVQRMKLLELSCVLQNCNPKDVLKRGYAVVKDKVTQKIIRHQKETSKGQLLDVALYEGCINATVE